MTDRKIETHTCVTCGGYAIVCETINGKQVWYCSYRDGKPVCGKGEAMSVYVDNMRAAYGRMKMCHMIADNTEELLAMADRIGVARKWLQYAGTSREHFDIALSKRDLAVKAGAIEVSMMEIGRKIRERRAT